MSDFDELSVYLPGGTVRREQDTIHAIVPHSDGWFVTRGRTAPFAEIFVAMRPLDGFTLDVRWGDRRRDPDIGEPLFDSQFALATNDIPLMRSWLDETARNALIGSAYAYETPLGAALAFESGVPGISVSRRTWTYEMRGLELVATKGTLERDPARFAVALQTACAIAARPYRWAQEYAALARSLDGAAATVVELGGDPVITATRRATEVAIRLLRQGAGAERLRTAVSCARLGHGADTFSLVRDDLDRKQLPAVPDGRRTSCDVPGYDQTSSTRPARTIDEATRKLLGLARPAALVVEDARVTVWFDGAPMQRETLDVGIELASRWAIEGGEARGPYR